MCVCECVFICAGEHCVFVSARVSMCICVNCVYLWVGSKGLQHVSVCICASMFIGSCACECMNVCLWVCVCTRTRLQVTEGVLVYLLCVLTVANSKQ